MQPIQNNNIMRLLSYTLLNILILASLNITAQNYTFKAQNTPDFTIQKSDLQHIGMQYSMSGFNLNQENIKGESMQRIALLQHITIPGEAGLPDLPTINKNIALPQGAIPQLSIHIQDSVVLKNINIAPNQRIPFDTEPDYPIEKGSVYTQNKWFPEHSTQLEVTEIRGMQVARLYLCPFKYNPVNQTLVVYKNIDIDLSWAQDKGTYTAPRFRSRYWDAILKNYISNYNDIPAIDYNKRTHNEDTDGCDYLILIPDIDVYRAWADSLKNFRNEQGIHTRVMTIPEVGGNTVSNLKNFFTTVYNTWNPVPSAVLLMADYADEGDDTGFSAKSWTHPNEGIYISDNYYADISGNNLPDFVFARMTANNEEELSTMVNKCINYETNPPRALSFYHQPITALGWQTERWFQLCSETVGGYMRTQLNREPIRINEVYDGNPAVDPWSTADNTYTVLSAFGPNGLGYIPATPGELGGWDGGSATDIVNAINHGAFMLMHRDHGGYSGWGEPGFSSGHIKQLSNTDKPIHVFSINCLTGQFNEGDGSFAERLHRYNKGGALSITAASQVSYSFVNDALVWGIMDDIWPDFLPNYGNNNTEGSDFLPAFNLASGKYYLAANNWTSSYYKIITYRLFHHHGDAFNTVYYEQPKTNNILHDKYVSTNNTQLSVEAEKGSLVGLSKNGELLASVTVPQSGNINIDFPAQPNGTVLKLVITKQNYLRYESHIHIIETNSSFVSLNKVQYNDANTNDSIENGEQASLNLWLKNIGTQNCDAPVDITLSSSNPNIIIEQNNCTTPALSVGESVVLNAVLSFSTANNIEDLESIPLDIEVDGNTFHYTTTAYAPKLQWEPFYFEETANGNGNNYIDPGESVIARFTIRNVGHAQYPSGALDISSNSAFINLSHTTQSFDAMQSGDSIVAECNISCDASVPVHSIAELTANINATTLQETKTLRFSIGQIIEDWETQSFNSFNWQFTGDAHWEISDRYKFDGEYSAATPDLEDNQSASLILKYDCLDNSYISFHLMVSSEFNHDFMSFYIDDELQGQWSKLLLFSHGAQTFPVSAGVHTFRWTYTKDEAGHSGADKCWLDHIILPVGNSLESTQNIDKETTNHSFAIYPNPARNNIHIANTLASADAFGVELWNNLGKLMMRSNTTNHHTISLATNALANGIYFVRIVNKRGEVLDTQKVMIVK